jgi:IS5 family transposase
LGRPKSDPELVAAEKQKFIDDQRQRNAVEGKIGQGKRRYGLGLIREKLAVTQGSTIAMNVLLMNFQKLLDLLFVFFGYWLQYLLDDGAGKRLQTARLNIQIAPA